MCLLHHAVAVTSRRRRLVKFECLTRPTNDGDEIWSLAMASDSTHVHWPCTVDHHWPPPTALYASSTSLHESRPSPTIPVVGVQSYRTRGYITPECRALYPCRPSTYNDGGGRLRHAEWVLLRNNSTQRRSKSQVSRRAVLMAYRTRSPVNLQTPVSHAHSTCLE